MKEVKLFKCEKTPTDDEITESIKLATEQNIVVRLEWFVQYSGTYRTDIDSDSTIETVRNSMPKVYPI